MTDFKNGSVKIANEIVDQLIAESALKVEGVDSVIGYKNQKVDYKKKEGIVSIIDQGKMEVALTLVLDGNSIIYDTCEAVQKNVQEQLDVMLGLDVTKVNIVVKDVIYNK